MEWNRLYQNENNKSLGYAVGNEHDDINAIEGIGALIKRAENSSDVAVYDNGTHWVVVGDSHGPWAMDFAKVVRTYVVTNIGDILVQVMDATSKFGFYLADDDQTWDGGWCTGQREECKYDKGSD